MNVFNDWRETMGFKNIREAAHALGYSETQGKKFSAGTVEVPFATRLAMTALYHRLEAWPDSQQKTR